MDDIVKLIHALAAGHMTAAMPLMDALREQGMWAEASSLSRIMSQQLKAVRRQHGRGTFRYARPLWREVVEGEFWHLLPGGYDVLEEAEREFFHDRAPEGSENG